MSRFVVVATPEEIPLIAQCVPAFITDPVIVTGVGGVNVIHALRDIPRDSEIVNVGYAGSADIPIGTAVSIGVVSLFHPVCPVIEPLLAMTLGTGNVHCYTAGDFVTSAHKRGCVYDMELAYIAALGFRSIRAVKVVSDHQPAAEEEEE